MLEDPIIFAKKCRVDASRKNLQQLCGDLAVCPCLGEAKKSETPVSIHTKE
jgi:hypothetical protein